MAIAQLVDLRSQLEGGERDIVVSGCIGPRGDGYDGTARMSARQSQDYHSTVGLCQRGGAVAKQVSPVFTGPPGHRLENETDPQLCGHLRMLREIAIKTLPARFVVQQGNGCEKGKVVAVMNMSVVSRPVSVRNTSGASWGSASRNLAIACLRDRTGLTGSVTRGEGSDQDSRYISCVGATTPGIPPKP